MTIQEGGWIKLYRSMLDWEWWDDLNTRSLFLTCLLMANSAERRWKGIVIPRGAFVTSCTRLAQKSSLSVRQMRTALKHLKSTHDVTCETTHGYTIVTVCNFDRYQEQAKAEGHSVRHTDDTPPTHGGHTADNKQEEDKGRKKEMDCSSSPNVEEEMPVGATGASFDAEKEEELGIDYERLALYWNEKSGGRFGIVRSIQNQRRDLVRARVRAHGKKGFREAVDKACASDFLAGAKWFNFDWLIRPNNFDKVMAGNFDNRQTQRNNGKQETTARLGLGDVSRPGNSGIQTDI